jgi:parallel beta-helix repeat protein
MQAPESPFTASAKLPIKLLTGKRIPTRTDILGGLNGTLMNGATYGTGVNGTSNTAFSFDGVDDYVNIADNASLEFTTQMTADAWFNTSTTAAGLGQIVNKMGPSGNYAYSLMRSGSGIRADFSSDGNGGGNYVTISSASGLLTAGEWYHAAVTFNSGLAKLYLNGVEVASSTLSISNIYASGNSAVNLGRDGGNIQFFSGRIDDVGLYNRSLTAAEINTIVNARTIGKTLPSQNNAIRGNSIYGNGGFAIDLAFNSVTANDAAPDGDVGPNGLQNFPVISTVAVVGSNTTISGTLASKANTTYTLDFYSSSLADASGYGEAQTYVGSGTVTTDGSGNATYRITVASAATGPVSATATEQLGGSNLGGTSEMALSSTPLYTISGTIFEDVNYGGGAGRNFATAAASAPSFDVDVETATVELYDTNGNFVTSTTTDANGAYSFNVNTGNYSVRVVNSTVLSNRSGATGSLIGVQTYRTTASSGAAVAVTDYVGGETPNEVDAAANNGSQTFATLDNASGFDIQSVSTVTVGSSNITSIDFGFNFDTIVNTNDAGQGSLRQFILNSNALANTNLAQSGQTAGKEVSIFMIANGQAVAGLNTSYANLLTGTIGTDAHALITLSSALPTVSGANANDTIIDATTQTTFIGNTNAGTVGTNGATSMAVGVGADGIAGTGDDEILNAFQRPEVAIYGNQLSSNLLTVSATNFGFRGFALWGNAGTSGSSLNLSSSSGHLIQDNFFGANALGVAQAGNATGQNDFVTIGASVTGATVYHNYVTASSHAANLIGVYPNIGSTNVILDSNEFTGSLVYGTPFYTANSTAKRNYFHDIASYALISSYGPFANQTIENNTFHANGYGMLLQGTSSGIVRYNLITSNTNGLSDQTNGSNVTFTKNSIFNNTGLGIDLSSVTSANDGTVSASLPNYGIDSPVITATSLVGTTLTVTGYIGTAAGDTDFANATIELYKAAVDASGYGEGQYYLGTITGSVTNGNFSGSITLPGSVSFAVGDTITSTATIAAYGTSEFGANATLRSISGKVFEDKDGNLLAGAEAIGDSNNPGLSGVTVKLYVDGGDGVASGADDILISTTTTNGSGAYSFSGVAGTLWVVVDSKTIASSVALNGGFTNSDTWADQTYGVAGALIEGGGYLGTAGAAFSGRSDETSDDAATLAGAQHVTRVIVTSADVTDLDSGFSFQVVTRTGDGDDDGATNRTVQGSLRQFLQNANAISGVQTSGFRLQTTDANYSGGVWTISPTAALPTLSQSVTLDGSTQSGYTNAPLVIVSGSSAGSGIDGLTVNAASTINAISVRNFTSDGIAVASGGTGTTISRSTFSGNGALGIDLGNDGVTVNDSGDSDTGANSLQNFPVLTRAVANGTDKVWLSGTLNSAANASYRIEFFSSPTADGSGYGEAGTYLGSTSVTTNSSGDVSFDAVLGGVAVTPGHVLTATATRILPGGTLTDTSEFSLTRTLKSAPTATNLNPTTRVYLDGVSSVDLDNIVVSDADGDTVTAKLTMGTPTSGTLSANNGATYDSTYGIWTITGSVSTVNTALANVVFQPGTYNVADTTISAQITDSDGATTSVGSITLVRSRFEPTGLSASDAMGDNVAISGDWAILGAKLDDTVGGTDAGSVYIYKRNSDATWSLFQQLFASDGAASDNFATSVDIDGTRAVVGASLDDSPSTNAGSAYVFEFNGTAWVQVAKMVAGDAAASDQYGISVAVSGSTIAIGAHADDDGGTNTGSVYVYTGSGASWTQQQKLTASDRAASDQFGRSLSLDGERLVVGSHLDDTTATDTGSAYVFDRSGSVWTETAKLVASDSAESDTFGFFGWCLRQHHCGRSLSGR